MAKDSETENIHAGHRKNMRSRYIESGSLESFSEHQILEMLLFYAIARRDVNPLAHKLIDHFGSLKEVLTASIDELVHAGLSENSAVLLKLTGDIGKAIDKKAAFSAAIRNTDDAMKLCHSLLFREEHEVAALICLDAKNRVIRVFTKTDGTTLKVTGLPKWIVESALSTKAVSVVIAHNHPSGSIEPSAKDTETTAFLSGILKSIDVKLLDHIIVTFDSCYSMLRDYLVSDIRSLEKSETDTDCSGTQESDVG